MGILYLAGVLRSYGSKEPISEIGVEDRRADDISEDKSTNGSVYD